MTEALDDLSPETARNRLVAQLTARGYASDPHVAAALAKVPRHLFAPAGTSLRDAYADNTIITKRDTGGATTSSVSAPWLQAYMLETARLTPGARVLEIGSSGYNAALIAELVGPHGAVTSIDIDADVVHRARTALTAAGYPEVQVIEADAEYGYPANGPFDAIIVTVEASDVPPSWIEQLTETGRLVVPLRMRAHTRCLTLQRTEDHLAATAALQCGFVTMQGAGQNPVRRIPLRGDDAVLQLDDATQVDAAALAAALDMPRAELWAPAIYSMTGGEFEALHLWLASQSRPYGTLRVDRDRITGLLDPQDRFFCPTLLTETSLAYLSMRWHGDNRYQFGAHGFGPDAGQLTQDLLDLLQVWHQEQRRGPGPRITVHPTSSIPPAPESGELRLLVRRRFTATAITWPAGTRR